MNKSTKYWLQEVKNVTLKLDQAQKNLRKCTSLLAKCEQGSPQYTDIQQEIKYLNTTITKGEQELLAIKCAALSKCQKTAKSTQKAGFATNESYRDHLIVTFLSEHREYYEGYKTEEFLSELFAILQHHESILDIDRKRENHYAKQKDLTDFVPESYATKYPELYEGMIEGRVYSSTLGGWYTPKPTDEYTTQVTNFLNAMHDADADKIERRTR